MEQIQHMEHMGKVFPNYPEDPWVKFPYVDKDGNMHIYYVDTSNGKALGNILQRLHIYLQLQ